MSPTRIALLETYRAQIEHARNSRSSSTLFTKPSAAPKQIAVLHGKSFDDNEMAK